VKIKPAFIPDLTKDGKLILPKTRSTASLCAIVNQNGFLLNRLVECSNDELISARNNNGKIIDAKGYNCFMFDEYLS